MPRAVRDPMARLRKGGKGKGKGGGRGAARGGSRQSRPAAGGAAGGRRRDVYEADDQQAPEERQGAEERYDAVDNFQYELPSDFEDEEITSESEGEEGAGGKGGGGGESDVDSEELAAELFGAGGGEGSDEEGDYEDEGSESDDGEEQEAESEEEDVMAYAGDAEEGGDAAHAAMLAEALGGGSTRRRRDVDVLTAGARESAAALTGTGEMSVDAIAAAMGGAGGAASTADARKLLRRVARRAAEGAAVAAPLPANVAARLARKAGYEASKAELGGWQDMVQRNRQAATEDLRAKPTAQGTSTAALGAKFTPKASGVEADVGDLLSAAGLTEERAAAAAEALELNELAAEEVTERQSKLSRMRNLMFYHEVKAKRAKKIKSRAYHKHLKKQALKEGNLALDDVELEDTEEARRELAQRREFERLEERLTLKHKNTGKWAKQMLKAKLGGHNTSVRQAVAEQLRLNQALTRKMDSMRDEEDSSSEEEEDEEAETGKDRRAASVAALEELVNEEEGAELPSKGLFSLPFMKRAIEKKRQAAQQEAKEMLREMDEMEADEDDDSEGDEGDGARGGGVRRAAADQDDDEDYDDDGDYDDDADEGVGAGGAPTGGVGGGAAARQSAPPGRGTKRRADASSDDESESGSDGEDADAAEIVYDMEGGVAVAGGMGGAKRARRGDGDSASAAERIAALSKGISNGSGSKRAATVMGRNGAAKRAPSAEVAAAAAVRDDALEVDGNDDGVTGGGADGGDGESGGSGLAGSEAQRALLRQAFAADDVAADFAREKAELYDTELPPDAKHAAEEAAGMPGWGNWSGKKKSAFQKKKEAEAAKQASRERRVAEAKRRDAGKAHVIISEKYDKKAAILTARQVPFGFGSKEVYEASLRQPIGVEFHGSDTAFRELTRPKLLKTEGSAIAPPSKPKGGAPKASGGVAKRKGGKRKPLASSG